MAPKPAWQDPEWWLLLCWFLIYWALLDLKLSLNFLARSLNLRTFADS